MEHLFYLNFDFVRRQMACRVQEGVNLAVLKTQDNFFFEGS